MTAAQDIGPTARALRTLELIQANPGVTAQRIADELEVSERAARRCVTVLRDAGIAIESVRGPYGGYRMGRGLRLPPLVFTGGEALGLVMAVLDGHHDAADRADPAGSALAKIVRALPEPVAAAAEVVRQSTTAAPDRAAARPDAGTTTTLVQAVQRHRVVHLDYRSEAGRAWTAQVQAWAVVVRHGRWYLLGRSTSDSGTLRAYRIDRVQQVTVTDETFVPPADLDPVGLLEEHLAVGWEYRVEVDIDAPLEKVRRVLPRSLGRLTAVDDLRCHLSATTGNPYWYAEQLAVLPSPFTVVDGPELRAAVRDLGARFLAAGGGERHRA
ncbi:helix-turn-helix transcriptional regulator [Nakamurella alba]|uniref:helix-turn-helix transcriptional regulator n=1 Tax=Nakamurella alba TaxID=2665158 RepID=UPI002AC340FC|nr:WYL domain-containing protein [Nakamurella alba]